MILPFLFTLTLAEVSPSTHPFAIDLNNQSDPLTWDSGLTVDQFIDSALFPYQLTEHDKLQINIKAPSIKGGQQLAHDMSGLPVSGNNKGQNAEITIPFDSDTYIKEQGAFQLDNFLTHIKEHVEKISRPEGINSNIKNAAHCGGLATGSKIEITLSNCNYGTISNTYHCDSDQQSTHWKVKDSKQSSSVSDQHCQE